MVTIVAVDRWYATQRKLHGITLVYEPAIKPFFRCNMRHVRGRNRDLLFDTASVPFRFAVLSGRPIVGVVSHTRKRPYRKPSRIRRPKVSRALEQV